MLIRLDRAEDRFRAAHIAHRPDGAAIVYPDGLLAQGYLLTSPQLETYLAERDRRLQTVIGRQKKYVATPLARFRPSRRRSNRIRQ